MRVPDHHTEAQVVHRSQTGPPDEFGTPTWEETETGLLVTVFPVASDEVEDRPAGRFTHQVFAYPDAVIFSNDSLVLADGRSWEVDGPAHLWTHPRSLRNIGKVADLVGYSDELVGS